ncbi:MAG: DUF4388 domain-containing protein [Nitrospinota bacterium]|nr:DUF4388 domain-containing protein [Nitrospinota bacterium]MDH5755308.1 DUF4388 domain-containing protein [Nitrospinota bacterium]
MALKGSLEDFSIVNILQMIKLEGKTGKLLLNDKDDEVKITFDKGSIIYAEGGPARDEVRIENTLVANSLLPHKEWLAVKKEHDDQLKTYWDLLSKKIETPVLLEMINRQTVDTVYYALRWIKGTYEFTPVKNLRYNNKVMRPMDVDGILMEGCRIADEWTRVSASIPPFDTFIVKNILGDEDQSGQTAKKEEAPKDFQNSLEFDVLTARGIALKPSQITVLSVIGPGKTIHEIMNAARQGSFTTLEAIQALLTMGVIKTTKKKGQTMMAVDHSSTVVPLAIAAALAGLIALGVYQNFLLGAGKEAKANSIVVVKNEEARHGLKKIERALNIHFTLYKDPPSSIDDLENSGALTLADTLDPWENKYVLEVENGKYKLYSKGPDIGLLTDNINLEFNI